MTVQHSPVIPSFRTPLLVASLLIVGLFSSTISALVCDPAYPYRSIDGSCNNLNNPYLGVGHLSTGSPRDEAIYLRQEPAEYSNVTLRSSPRDSVVSSVIVGVNRVYQPDGEPRRIDPQRNVLFAFLGQFLIHDLTNTDVVPFDPFRPNPAPTPPDENGRNFTLGLMTADRIDEDGIPQQFNLATAFIDLSPTYGVTNVVSGALRAKVDGLLLTTNRTQFTYNFTNFPNLDLCHCINTTTGQPFFQFDGTGQNTDEVLSSTIRGFAPEPFPFLGKCVSPAASFGVTTLPGGGTVPNVPGVYSCSITAPPKLLADVSCSIDYGRIASPLWSSYTWNIPDPTQWQPFVSQTNPPVPFDMINSQTRDPAKALAAGDKRNSENFGILMVSQLMLRIHNARARLLKIRNSTWDDEKLFQEARKWSIAVWQQIIYQEWLPWVIDEKAYKKAKFGKESDANAHTSYDPDADPRISNVFATSAMRFHSTIPKVIFPVVPDGNGSFSRVPATRTQVYAHFLGINNPGNKSQGYVSLPFSSATSQFGTVDDMMAYYAAQLPIPPDHAIMAGIINQKANAIGHFVDRGLADVNIGSCFTPHLFASVPALTTFRGRIHGIPNYHKLREIYARDSIYGKGDCPNPTDFTSPDPLACFLRMTDNDLDKATMLRDTYGRLDRIDPWFGLMIENESSFKVEGSLVGKTSSAVIVDQFERLRSGDRFFYTNQDVHNWSTQDWDELMNATLHNLVATHFPTLADHLPQDLFVGSVGYPDL